MSWSLSIYGHDAPAKDVTAAVREAFAELAEKAGATGGSLTGSGNDGETFGISFPEPAAAGEDDASVTEQAVTEPRED